MKHLSKNIKDTTKLNENFFEQVYKVAIQIPKGKVTSYGAIAKFLGSARSARMVGWAMNQSFFYKNYVPAHRVVNRNGILSGKHHFSTETEMETLLKSEGLKVLNDKILNLEKYFWDPCKELI